MSPVARQERPARGARGPSPTRERILDVSLQLFNELGAPNVTTNLIADSVGISPGNLYYHFRHKEDIINGVYERYEQRVRDTIDHPGEAIDSAEDLWLVIHLAFEAIYDYRFLYRNLNDLTGAYAKLRGRFTRQLDATIARTEAFLGRLAAEGTLHASPEEVRALALNMTLVTAYWLNLNGLRRTGETRQDEGQLIARGAYQVLALITPHLRGDTRQAFADVALRYLDET